MSRWHESSCKRPDVTTDSSMIFCNYCFALGPEEMASSNLHPPNLSPPPLASRSWMGLNWPATVSYINVLPPSTRVSELPTSSPTITSTRNTTTLPNPPNLQQNWLTFPQIDLEAGIRLLHLTPGGLDDPIHADFERINLDGPSIPAYTALSYTSTDQSNDKTSCCPIFIGPYWDIIYITHSCKQAIRSVRSKHAHCLIWVDCVCIQLGDVDERNHQVGLMHEIYSNASKVVAYLGEELAHSSMTLNFIKEAVADFLISGNVATIDANHQKALASLFARPYFSRLWVIQEVLLAKELEIVCGLHSLVWPNLPLARIINDFPGPNWFCDRFAVHERILKDRWKPPLYLSYNNCSDPRDKIFGLLGLVNEWRLRPDYTLSVENVYTGLASHLIKNHSFEILAFCGGQKRYNTPSWVPDWSRKVDSQLPTSTYFAEKELDSKYMAIELANPLVFEIADGCSNRDVEIDGNTGSLHLYALKLCDLLGEIVRIDGQTKIVMRKPQQGILIISLLDSTYEVGPDSVFLLNGWDHPVILRSQPNTDSYSFISACALEYGRSSGSRFLPWSDSANDIKDKIRFTRFSSEEYTWIQHFYSGLIELCSNRYTTVEDLVPETSPYVLPRVLDFTLLSLTRLREIERRLWEAWNALERNLGWMFLDQNALWILFGEVDQGRCGSSNLQLQGHEANGFLEFCGLEFQKIVSWDVRRFLSSFLRLPAAISPNAWSPVLSRLKLQLPEIQRWAEVTEQLLKVFEYSNLVLARSSFCPPGSELPDKWLRCWRDFSDVIDRSLDGYGDNEMNLDCQWDWSEFKDCLRSRDVLWKHSLPQQLRPVANYTMAVHLGFRALGLNMSATQRISIV